MAALPSALRGGRRRRRTLTRPFKGAAGRAHDPCGSPSAALGWRIREAFAWSDRFKDLSEFAAALTDCVFNAELGGLDAQDFFVGQTPAAKRGDRMCAEGA